MRNRLTLAFVLVAALLAPRAAFAWPGTPIKTKVAIPFSGVVYHPAAAEHVVVSGTLNVKTTVGYPPSPVIPPTPVIPPVPIKVTTSYKLAAGATATGQTSGNTYSLKGVGKTQYFVPSNPIYPNNPVRTLTHDAVLIMLPNSPVFPGDPVKGFHVQYQVNFDDNGVSTGSAAAIVPDAAGVCAPVAARCSSEQPLVVPSLCTDGIKNQDETDVDCGGAICSLRCSAGASCVNDFDCHSDVCVLGVCDCATVGLSCVDDTDCCGGLTCGPTNICQ